MNQSKTIYNHMNGISYSRLGVHQKRLPIGEKATTYASRIKKLPDELNRINNRLQKAHQNLEDQRENLQELGFPRDVKADLSIIETWDESYKRYIEYQENFLQWVPKTLAWDARKQYRRDQNNIRKLIPSQIWQKL